MELNHFQLLRSVGRGAFGKVQIVQHLKTKRLYALKYINKEKCISMNAVENILQERSILEKVKHPFLCNLCYSFQDEENLFMVLELELGGDLRFHLDRKGPFAEDAVRFFVAELSMALDYLHEKCRIIHRDIKPDNVLLDEHGYAHLTDFNIAVKMHQKRLRTSIAGSLAYMAPEIFLKEGYDGSVDWWSLGVLAFELLTGRRPFNGKTNDALTQSILEDTVHWPSSLSESTVSLAGRGFVMGLLCRNPKQRLGTRGAGGLAAIKAHPWFSGISFNELLDKRLPSPFCPDSRKINFDAAHELEEVLMEDNPLRVRPRKRTNGGTPSEEPPRVFSSPEMAKMAPVFEARFRTYDFTKPVIPLSASVESVSQQQPSTTFESPKAGISANSGSESAGSSSWDLPRKDTASPLVSQVGLQSANYRLSVIKLPPPKPSDKPVTDIQLQTIGSNEDSPHIVSLLEQVNSTANLPSTAENVNAEARSDGDGGDAMRLPSTSDIGKENFSDSPAEVTSMVTPRSHKSFTN